MNALYISGLIFGLAGLVIIDHRYSLALFDSAKLTLQTLAVGIFTFIVWDVVGINAGIFFSGHSPYMLGLYVLKNLPLEEFFFLTLLCYVSLLLYKGVLRWQRT